MELLDSLAQTFAVTRFDAGLGIFLIVLTLLAYYYLSLHQVFEMAFGAIVGLGIYVFLSVLLLGNGIIGSTGGLFPFGFSVFVISISVYLVYILAVLFPLHGGLVVAEPTHPTLYTLLYFFTAIFFFFSMAATMVYMIDQAYIFKPGTVFTLIKDTPWYLDGLKNSVFYRFVIVKQDVIIPLGIILMLYKLLLSNVVNAALLSIWYNLKNIGFYRKKQDSAYRVEFHEVGGVHASAGSDDHGSNDSHDNHNGHH